MMIWWYDVLHHFCWTVALCTLIIARPGHLRRMMKAPRVMMRRHQERTTERATARTDSVSGGVVSLLTLLAVSAMSCVRKFDVLSARTRKQVAGYLKISISTSNNVTTCYNILHHVGHHVARSCNSSPQVSNANGILNTIEPYFFIDFPDIFRFHVPLQHYLKIFTS